MKKARRIVSAVLVLLLGIVVLTGWYLRRHTVDILQPAGTIGAKERGLIEFCALLSLVVVVPVFTMLTYIAVHYREGNTKATYKPDQGNNLAAEITWWVIPAVLIGIIGTVTWRTCYQLDPFKPLGSSQTTMHIQVVSLDWKWLFIYPDQHMASVKTAYIPANTPVDFEITSDTVMNSFWVPQLGGQMYAMPGMSTNLNLEASRPGVFNGSSANIAGKGFADMTFQVMAVPPAQYGKLMQGFQDAPNTGALTASAYNTLAKPSITKSPQIYNAVEPSLYDRIVLKYMTPSNQESTVNGSEASSL